METEEMKTRAFYRRISALGKEGIDRLRREGRFTGRAPVGYCNARDEFGWATIVLQEPEAGIVRRMFALRAEGHSVREVQRYAAEAGLRGRSGKSLSLAGVHWILNCPTYRGLVRTPEGALVPGRHEAIV